jgi:hypothetical protein
MTDLTPAAEYLAAKSRGYLADLPRAVSLDIRLNERIVDANLDKPQPFPSTAVIFQFGKQIGPSLQK